MKFRTSRQFLSRLARRRSARLLGAALSLTLGSVSATRAANYTWDPTQTSSTNGGGPGTWDKTLINFYNGTNDVAWADGNTAIFGGTPGTGVVNLGVPISAAAVNFNSGGYTITAAGTNTLTLTGTGAAGSTAAIYTNGTGITNTIAGPLIISVGTGTQTWNVSTGDRLNITGAVSQTGAGILIASGGGAYYFSGTAFTPNKFSVTGGSVFNSSGTVNIPVGGTYTGIGDGGSGTLNVTAGTFTTAATLFLGSGGGKSGTVNVTGGTFTTTGTINIGDGFNNGGNDIGVLTVGNVAGTTALAVGSAGTLSTGSSTGTIRVGNAGSGSGTINLEYGGLLSSNSAFGVGSYSTTTSGLTKANIFNFDGGTLQANGVSLAMTGLTANVRNGGAIVNTNNFAVTLANNLVHSTMSGDATTDGGLTKNGAGALTLSGTNTFNGATVINSGSIVTGSALALGSSILNYNNQGGSLSFGTQTAVTLGGLSGAQNLALTNTTPAAVALSVGNNGTNTTYSGALSGAGSLLKIGTGTLNLSGASSYSGGTTINAGNLLVTNSSALGTGSITINGTGATTAATGGTLQLSGNVTLTNTIVGLPARNDPGTTATTAHIDNVSGNNTVTSSMLLTGGGAGAVIVSDAGTLTLSGNFYNNSGSSYARPIYLAGGGNGLISGNITNTTSTATGTALTYNLSVNKEGTGTWRLTGNNTYTGGTIINGGTLQAGSANALGTSGSINFTGGTLQYGSGITTDYSSRITGSTSAVSIDTNGNNVTYGTALANTNTGGLTKLGAGTLTLNTTEAYTGTTTVNRGTLALDFNAAGAPATNIIPSTSALVMGGGTLSVLAQSGTATSQTVNGVTFNSGGSAIAVNPAATNPNAVVLNLGAITRNTGSTVVFTLPGGGQNSGYGITTSSGNFSSTSSNAGGQGILGGYATTDLFNYATVNGGNIVTYTGEQEYNNVAGFSNVSGKDITDGLGNGAQGYDGTATNSVSINSLRFNQGSADPTVNINGGNTLTIASGGILVTPNLGAKYARINGGSLTTGSAADLIVIQNNDANSGHLQIGSAITGTGGLTKSGVGQLDLNGSDATYTGVTTVNGGTVQLTAATTGTTNVTLNNTGTLLLGANDRINDAATVTLNGGTLNTGGFKEGNSTGTAAATTGLGALTLSTTSTLDFGAGHSGSSVLAFAASNTQTWSGTLTLADFTPGTDFLNFASSTGLTTLQLSQISLNGFAANGLDSFGNVSFMPVPEPATWAAGILMLGAVGYEVRRRMTARRAA